MNVIYNFFNLILVDPMFNVLVALYSVLGNLGVSIIIFTLLIRVILIPLTLPSIQNMKKQKDLQPELDKLKKKYADDKQKLAEAQMELFKKHGLNPASGCLTQIVMIIVLISLFSVIRKFSLTSNFMELNDFIYFDSLKLTHNINTNFWYLNLALKDQFYILPVLSGIFQFVSSKMMLPYVDMAEKAAETTPDKSDDLAYNVQQQMVYTMPFMNTIFSATMPSGLALYIVVTTLFSIVQTYYLQGWGGMQEIFTKLQRLKNAKS